MAVADEGVVIPQSTGAVPGPATTVAHEQVVDNTSTGAVDAPEVSVTTKFGPSGQKPTGAVPNPEPTTHVNPVVKVVNGPDRQQARGATTAETDAGQRSGRRAADVSVDDTDGR